MKLFLQSLLVGFTLVLAVGAPATETNLVLDAEVVVHSKVVRVGDLTRTPIDDELASTVLFAAPRPGHERKLSLKELRRRFVELGLRRVPRLSGAKSVRIRRSGALASSTTMERAVQKALDSMPLPPGALGQRWEILTMPRVRAVRGELSLRILDPGPLVGPGSIRVRVMDGGSSASAAFVRVRRSLRVVGTLVERGAKAGAGLPLAALAPDSLWVDRLVDWQQLFRFDESRAEWTFAREVKAGSHLRRNDLRPVLLVHRGQTVEWKERRGSLVVRSQVRARSDGALGDWILVQSPFDRRLRRVCVVAEGAVSSGKVGLRETLARARQSEDEGESP